ncbi:MAG: hypothetical protein ABI402_03845 [Ferruginibacter sp.]
MLHTKKTNKELSAIPINPMTHSILNASLVILASAILLVGIVGIKTFVFAKRV